MTIPKELALQEIPARLRPARDRAIPLIADCHRRLSLYADDAIPMVSRDVVKLGVEVVTVISG